MAKRIIAAVSAAHEKDGIVNWANQGQEIDLTPENEKALEEQGALVPSQFGSFQEFSDYKLDAYRAGRGDVEAAQRLATRGLPIAVPDSSGGIVDISAPSDPAGLAAYLRERKPTVEETVALAEDDPQRARVVLEAESTATGGEPRKGVETALQRIIDSAE